MPGAHPHQSCHLTWPPSPPTSKLQGWLGQGGGVALLAPGPVALVACVEGPQHHVRPACRARRAAKEAKEAPAQPAPEKVKVEVKKFVKIGRPGYKGKGALWPWRAAPHPPTPTPTSSASGECLYFPSEGFLLWGPGPTFPL